VPRRRASPGLSRRGSSTFRRTTAPIPISGPSGGTTTATWRTARGRRFGFQLTFFRNSLSPHPKARISRWATNEVYLAHFALTDVQGGRFRSYERLERGAVGLAGAQGSPFRVWLGDWSSSRGTEEGRRKI